MNWFLRTAAFLAVGALVVPYSAHGQIAVTVAVSGYGPIELTQKVATSAFVASKSDSSGIFMNTATDQLKNVALTNTMGILAHVPLVGLPLMSAVGSKFLDLWHVGHKDSAKGFSIAYLKSISAPISIVPGTVRIAVPTQVLQGQTPDLLLLRLLPSINDSARIVRSTHIILRQNKSAINPTSAEVLGIEQVIVPSTTEADNGGIIRVTSRDPLASGEYALVMPNRSSSEMSGGLFVWDFKVQ